MSRDIIVVNVDKTNEETGKPDISGAQPLGDLKIVLTAIVKAFPDIDVSDTSWVILAKPGYSLAFNFNGRAPVQSLTISVHGNQTAMEDVTHFCNSTGWTGFDTSSGEYIVP